MSLVKGDHLRLERNGKIIQPKEDYHFVVIGGIHPGIFGSQIVSDFMVNGNDIDAQGDKFVYYDVRIRVLH